MRRPRSRATRWGVYLNTVIAWPTEVTIAATRLIFSGVMERHPGLQLVLSHGGGTLPFLAGRLDLAYHAPKHEANPACRAHISKPPSQYLRQFYYDTVVASAASLRLLIDLVGAERVMFGTDFPYEIGDADGAIARPVIEQLSPNQRQNSGRECARHSAAHDPADRITGCGT